MRNLDLTALRSFVTVAEAGGVTRAAGILNLTQSAVSMQLKRLEDSLGIGLLDRSARTISLTAAGEQLLSYAQRMLALNDEVYGRLTSQDYEGELRLGVPHDAIYPHIPQILKKVAAAYPRMKVKLLSSSSKELLQMFARGDCDFILTTEATPGEGGEILVTLPLKWVGAIGGNAWRNDPVPLALCNNCNFRPGVLRKLEEAGMRWDMAVDSGLTSANEAAVSADLAVMAAIDGGIPPLTEAIRHEGALPDLGETNIVLYYQRHDSPMDAEIAEMIRAAHRGKQANLQLATA